MKNKEQCKHELMKTLSFFVGAYKHGNGTIEYNAMRGYAVINFACDLEIIDKGEIDNVFDSFCRDLRKTKVERERINYNDI